MKLFRFSAMRRCGEQDSLLALLLGNTVDEMVVLLLVGGGVCRSGAGMDLVNDKQFRTLLDKNIPAGLRFYEVDADHLVGVVFVNAGVALDLLVETRLGVRA